MRLPERAGLPMRIALLLLVLSIARQSAAAQTVARADTSGFRLLMSFPVVDPAPVHEVPLGRQLVVRATHERGAGGGSMGWYVTVLRRPVGPTSRNLLYHSLAWHGPYPTDVFAWSQRAHYFPDDRTLSVHGWPYELRLVCRGCTVEGDSTAARFTAGTLEVGVRRLERANPPASR